MMEIVSNTAVGDPLRRETETKMRLGGRLRAFDGTSTTRSSHELEGFDSIHSFNRSYFS